MTGDGGADRVAVVTGGAAGIGAAIAEALARTGAFVVTVDPGVSLDGSTRVASEERSTAERIVEAGGRARASDASVTDADAIERLFTGLVDEFGSLDAVVNVAGISRPTGFASGTEDDWTAILNVHLNGYLTVLRAALPIMAAAGHGRILGVTSGSGWRAADAGAYSCAKRAVAALTWQIGRAAPPGVTINALSPIAATRMVAAALSRQVAEGNETGRSAASGGVSLGAVPPPEHLGPVGAYLASDVMSWCTGQVMFSNGSELAWVTPPHLLEVARAADVRSVPHALEALVPVVFGPAERAQVTSGGGNPRVGAIFDEPGVPDPTRESTRTCVVVTDDASWGEAVGEALAARDVECVGVGEWTGAREGAVDLPKGLTETSELLARVARDAGSIDAVVVALVGGGRASGDAAELPEWQRILDAHAGITDQIRGDAAWARAAADYSAASDRPVRVVTLTDATSAGGRSRAQAAAQLARAAHGATAERVDAFAIALDTDDDAVRRPVAELVGHLVCRGDAAALSGAELVAAPGWIGLRTHPSAAGTITFGGPEIPEWLDGALRAVVTGISA